MNANVQPEPSIPTEPHAGPAAPGKPVDDSAQNEAPRHSIIGGVARQWWRILLLWLVISTPLAYLIYATVEPTYEAISRIRIEPRQLDLYDPLHQNNGNNIGDSETYLQTQVNLITTDQVLNRAVANDKVVALSMIKGSEDPNTSLREKITVDIEPGTYIIRVALQSKDPNEPAAIVNAVVDSYLDENMRYTQTRDATLKASFTEQLASLKDQIERKKTELADLHQRGNVQIFKPMLNLKASNSGDGGIEPAFDSVDEQQLSAIIAAMVQTDLDLMAADAELMAKREAGKVEDNDEQLEDAIRKAFLNDPEVIALGVKMTELEDQRDRRKKAAGEGSDPDRVAAQKQLDHLHKQYRNLWDTKRDEVRKRITMATGGQPTVEAIAGLQLKVKIIQGKKDSYARMYERLAVKQHAAVNDTFRVTFATQELASLLAREEQVKRTLAHVEFQSRQEIYRVVLVDRARTPKMTVNNQRWKYMAAAPIPLLFVLLGWFLFAEINVRRPLRSAVAPTVRREVSTRREPTDGSDKIGDLAYACQRAEKVKRSGGEVALVAGRCEKIDYGLVHVLQFARNQGDFLIVGLESDESVERVQGPGRLFVPQDQRAYLLSLYAFVDLVVLSDQDMPLDVIQAIRPDVLVSWGDTAADTTAGAEYVRSYGGRVAMCPRAPGSQTV